MFYKIGGLVPNVMKRDRYLVKKDEEQKTGVISFVKKNWALVVTPIADMIVRFWKELNFSHNLQYK